MPRVEYLARIETSMRPAHSAREILRGCFGRRPVRRTSMRPAHSAREIRPLTPSRIESASDFNEARAFSAGNLASSSHTAHRWTHFNEARAFSAGNLVRRAAVVDDPLTSMRPAHSAREIALGLAAIAPSDGTSMRPAHSAREIPEATARGALVPRTSMRPAHSAREISRPLRFRGRLHHTSMRPAHSAREIGGITPRPADRPSYFNEARAFSAGNLVESLTYSERLARLQ